MSEIRKCRICKDDLPHVPRPVVNFSRQSKIVIIGQAPGSKVHASGIPWDDASGDRLRSWLGVEKKTFYDPNEFALVPMGFCYPGKGRSGDLPPRPECSEKWMQLILKTLKNRKLTLLIGQYSQEYFLGDLKRDTLTETVRHWRQYLPEYFVLPHPSPRNNIWLKKNPWFEKATLPDLREKLRPLLRDSV